MQNADGVTEQRAGICRLSLSRVNRTIMAGVADLNLIRVFDFYLALAFMVSTALRIHQYRAILGLVRAVPSRWPRLFELVKQHRNIFLTWATAVPAVLAFVLSAAHMLACRVLWPHANLTLADLAHDWMALPVVVTAGLAMVSVDLYATFQVGEVDRKLLEKYFDQAEYWLRSWVAPVVHVFTLGYINPRKMVAVEVRKALIDVSRLLNSTLWWVSGQVGLRIVFGLSLWLTFAWSHHSG
jgi:hypothetical protein